MGLLFRNALRISWALFAVRSGHFLGRRPAGIVNRLVLCEQDPEDPGILVGDGDRRPLESPAGSEIGNPGVSSPKILARRGQVLLGSDDGPFSVGQERTEIGVSPFLDSREYVLFPPLEC